MSTRMLKQFLYGIFFLLVLALIAWAVYVLFIKPKPSCFDGIQNEGEQGVDCGGPCAKLCIPASNEPITEIGSVLTFNPVPGHVTLLAQVVNPNADFAADTFSYTFNLYDASDNLIGTVPGSSFIYADQTKYLVAVNEPVSSPVDHAEIVIGAPHWVTSSTLGLAPQFTFQNVAATSSSDGTVAISGTIVDQDPASFNGLSVIAILKDQNGNPVGVTETQLDSISPSVPASFSVIYPIPAQNVNPAATEFDAYSMR